MKILYCLFAAGVLVASGARPAQADMLAGLGDWEGDGTLFSPEGRALQEFRVELTRSAAGPDSVETSGKVTLANGQTFPFSQRLTGTADGFRIESARGKGQGHCVSANVCYSSETDGAGNSSSTTVLVDAPDRLRLLVTEFEAGRPVRVTWQNLRKR